MAVDGKVTIGVEVESDEAKKQLDDFGTKGSDSLKKIGSAIKKAVAAVATGAMAKDIMQTGATFEKTMSEVKAISGATTEDMEKLTEAAKEMGAKSSFSASEAASALTYMSMAGWKTEDMLGGLEGIMNLAAASGEDLAMTSDIVTDALTAFGLKAEDSGKFADVLAAASSNANTNVGMLGESFKYIAPLAGAMKYSAEDTAVALGLMANAGIKGSQAGTALRAAITRMVKPTKQSGAAMDELGISMTNSDGSMKTLAELTDHLREKMGGLSEAEQAEAAAQIFGQEAMSGMLAIINASQSDYESLTEAIYESEGAAKEMADTRLDNLSGQFTLLKSAAEGLKLELFGVVSGGLTNLVKSGTDAVTKLTEGFKTGGIAGMANAAYEIVQSAIVGIQTNARMMVSSGVQMLSNLMDGIMENLPGIISAGANLITVFAAGIGQNLPILIPKALQMLVTIADAVISNIPKIVNAGIDILKGLVRGIIQSLPLIIKEGPRIINNFADAIYKGIGKMLSTGAKLIIELAKGIKSNWPLIKENAGQILMAIINVFSLSKMLSLGKSLMTNLGNGIKNVGPRIISFAKSIGTNALNAIKGINWLGTGGNIMQILGNGIRGMGGLLKNTALNVAKTALNAIKGIDVKSIGINIIKGIMSGITSMAKGLASAALGVVKSAVEGVKDFLKIRSPSRLMRDEVGHQMTAGIEVAWETDEKDMRKTAKDTMKHMTDGLGDDEYIRVLNSIDIPDVSAFTGVSQSEKRGAYQIPMKDTGINADEIKEASKQGIIEGIKNTKWMMEGKEVAHIIAPWIDKELAYE